MNDCAFATVDRVQRSKHHLRERPRAESLLRIANERLACAKGVPGLS
jgi:hypothetical protein